MSKKLKWIGLIFIFAAFLILGGVTESDPIANRVIVIGIGLDKDTETDALHMTAQIIIPGQSDASGAMDGKIVTVSDYTLSGALSKLNTYANKSVSLSHCSLIVFGQSVLSDNLISLLDYMKNNNYISENAYVAAAEGESKELFTMQAALTEMITFSLINLMEMSADFKTVHPMTVKDFWVNYYTKGQTSCLPVVTPYKTEGQLTAEGSSEKIDEYLFTMEKIAVIKGSKQELILDWQGAAAVNYMTKPISKGDFYVTAVTGEKLSLYILNKKEKLKYDAESKTVSAEITFSVVLNEVSKPQPNAPLDAPVVGALHEEDEKALKAQIQKQIAYTFMAAQENDADVYNLLQGFYRADSKKGRDIKIKDVKLESIIKFKYM